VAPSDGVASAERGQAGIALDRRCREAGPTVHAGDLTASWRRRRHGVFLGPVDELAGTIAGVEQRNFAPQKALHSAS